MPSDNAKQDQLRLNVKRMFSAPALTGELPSHVKISPDGEQIAWLQVAEDDRERLDLWIYNIASNTATIALDASKVGQSGILSDAEKAERERRRQFTGGVTNFHWHPNSNLPRPKASVRLISSSHPTASTSPSFATTTCGSTISKLPLSVNSQVTATH